MGIRPVQGDEKRLRPATTLPEEPPLPPCHPDRRSHGLRPTQGDEKRLLFSGSCSATTVPGSVALPFVISTEAQRSGEISVWMHSPGNVFRPERSVVEGPAVQRHSPGVFRPERSAAERSAVFLCSRRFAPAAATRRLDVQDVALNQVLAAFAG
jgi:hypothetical protein